MMVHAGIYIVDNADQTCLLDCDVRMSAFSHCTAEADRSTESNVTCTALYFTMFKVFVGFE